MNRNDQQDVTDIERRRVLGLMMAGSTLGVAGTANAGTDELSNSLLWALAWKQGAAEYFALTTSLACVWISLLLIISQVTKRLL